MKMFYTKFLFKEVQQTPVNFKRQSNLIFIYTDMSKLSHLFLSIDIEYKNFVLPVFQHS